MILFVPRAPASPPPHHLLLCEISIEIDRVGKTRMIVFVPRAPASDHHHLLLLDRLLFLRQRSTEIDREKRTQ